MIPQKSFQESERTGRMKPMKLMKPYFRIVIFGLTLVTFTKTAHAVPPPDFIFNVGTQIVQAFSIGVLFLTAIIASVRQYARVYFDTMKHKKLFWAGTGLVVIFVAIGSAYYYGQYAQNAEYEKWLADSQKNSVPLDIANSPLDKLKNTAPALVPAPIFALPDTPAIAFIKNYYANLGSGHIKEAYDVSKKSVSYETFVGWYKNTSGVSVDNVQSIDDTKYSLELTLKEKTGITRYGVLMTIALDPATTKFIITNSQVRILNDHAPQAQPLVSDPSSLSISNQEFQTVLNNNSSPYILDAREDEEVEIGRFPGSTHIRFADIQAGRWIDVPTDQPVYVLCWSGMRGKDVAEFLRTKNIQSRYIENGASGWVANKGKWDGEINFTSKYGSDHYKRVLTTDETKQKQKDGAFLVDSRMPSQYNKHHMEGSINIPMIYTPTSKIESELARVPAGAPVITVCDDFISCFDAKVTGIKLEKRGHEFLGRYNKP